MLLWLPILVFMGVVSTLTRDDNAMAPVKMLYVLYAAMMSVGTIEGDKGNRWLAYSKTMPITPIKYVAARYVFYALGIIGIGLVSAGIGAVFTGAKAFYVMLEMTVQWLVIAAFDYPVNFGMGGRYLRIISIIVKFAVIWLMQVLMYYLGLKFGFSYLALTAVVSVVLYAGSVLVSARLYERGEYAA